MDDMGGIVPSPSYAWAPSLTLLDSSHSDVDKSDWVALKPPTFPADCVVNTQPNPNPELSVSQGMQTYDLEQCSHGEQSVVPSESKLERSVPVPAFHNPELSASHGMKTYDLEQCSHGEQSVIPSEWKMENSVVMPAPLTILAEECAMTALDHTVVMPTPPASAFCSDNGSHFQFSNPLSTPSRESPSLQPRSGSDLLLNEALARRNSTSVRLPPIASAPAAQLDSPSSSQCIQVMSVKLGFEPDPVLKLLGSFEHSMCRFPPMYVEIRCGRRFHLRSNTIMPVKVNDQKIIQIQWTSEHAGGWLIPDETLETKLPLEIEVKVHRTLLPDKVLFQTKIPLDDVVRTRDRYAQRRTGLRFGFLLVTFKKDTPLTTAASWQRTPGSNSPPGSANGKRSTQKRKGWRAFFPLLCG